jgi:hypothetical protein
MSIKYDDDFVTIPQLDFYGPYSRSENGVFTLAWCDADPASGHAGNRTEGRGPFVLLRDDKIVISGSIERPHDGKVANNGIFILNDVMFRRELNGTFYAFSPDGTEILSHRFEANLHNNGLSKDGEFAVCQLCNSPSRDGGTLAFFDLGHRSLLWQIEPEDGWADSYAFDTVKRELTLAYEGQGESRYSFGGEPLG